MENRSGSGTFAVRVKENLVQLPDTIPEFKPITSSMKCSSGIEHATILRQFFQITYFQITYRLLHGRFFLFFHQRLHEDPG